MTIGGDPTLIACVDAAFILEGGQSVTDIVDETEARRSESYISKFLGEEESPKLVDLCVEYSQNVLAYGEIEAQRELSLREVEPTKILNHEEIEPHKASAREATDSEMPDLCSSDFSEVSFKYVNSNE